MPLAPGSLRLARQRAELLEPDDDLEQESVSSVTAPFVYALFIIIAGAIFSGSLPTWLMFLLVGLLLLGAFFKAAAAEVVQHRQRLITHDPDVDLPAAPDVLALLRSARVVLLPAIGHEATLQGIEEGLQGQGSMTLAQLAQHIRGMQNLPPGASLPEPVSEQELAALPTCTYTPRTLASRWQTSSTSTARSRAGDTSRCSGLALDRLESGCSDNTISCSICLEDLAAGETVMTLPCLHQYHVECVKPWLQRKGRHAMCPMCKTPVFL